MVNAPSRRRFLAGAAGAGAIALAGCTNASDAGGASTRSYEVWAADQGLNNVHIYAPAAAGGFEEIDVIDTAADGGLVPHMLDFTSDYAHVAIPFTAGGRVLVYRTADRALIGNIETGPGSHFASFAPDDAYLTVDVIGENRIAKVAIDWETETFEEVDELVMADVEHQSADTDPVCHQFDHHGRSIHTLGPSYHDAGVVVVDHSDFSIAQSFGGEELPANCGTVPHPTADKFYVTAGLPTPTDHDGTPVPDASGVGEYYVLDTSGETVEIAKRGSTQGIDAHGFWFTPDVRELWVLNRETNDGIILDPATDEQIGTIDAFGPATSADTAQRDSPDIMWASPDGAYMFVTLRGQSPKSGDPHAATGVNPGFAVFDIAARERVETIIPAAGAEGSDFHGIGVRPIASYDGYTSPPY